MTRKQSSKYPTIKTVFTEKYVERQLRLGSVSPRGLVVRAVLEQDDFPFAMVTLSRQPGVNQQGDVHAIAGRIVGVDATEPKEPKYTEELSRFVIGDSGEIDFGRHRPEHIAANALIAQFGESQAL